MSEQKKNDLTRSDQPQPGSGDADLRGDDRDRSELEVQARHLATYAASVNWQPGDNTREWLLGLRDLIEHVQALTRPNPGEMGSDLNLDELLRAEEEDDGSYLWERCYACGHRLAFASDSCPQCGEHFKDGDDPPNWPDECDCQRCQEARYEEARDEPTEGRS